MEAAFGQVFPFSHSEARSRQAAKRKIRIKKFNKKKQQKGGYNVAGRVFPQFPN